MTEAKTFWACFTIPLYVLYDGFFTKLKVRPAFPFFACQIIMILFPTTHTDESWALTLNRFLFESMDKVESITLFIRTNSDSGVRLRIQGKKKLLKLLIELNIIRIWDYQVNNPIIHQGSTLLTVRDELIFLEAVP